MMLSWHDQLERGFLVCPRSHQQLTVIGDCLQSLDGHHRYAIHNNVPLLLADPKRSEAELGRASGEMLRQYSKPAPTSRLRFWYRRAQKGVGDQRTEESRRALDESLTETAADSLCLSVGGGPQRVHPLFVNVNLGAFPQVDIVADAYSLPYADGCVSAIHCEAVLEHLELPSSAVIEMYRVLTEGGRLFAATPFIQPYHGYPDHYQNFTANGHRCLFERAGFLVHRCGTCVGPTFALRDVLLNYLEHAWPAGPLGRLLRRLTAVGSLPLLYLDRLTASRPEAVQVASTTFLLAEKSKTMTT
jgi:SAM-dependent methyltransferase